MEPSTSPQTRFFFKLKYRAAIRIWHWLTFLFITGTMVTVLFAKTLFEPRHEVSPPSNNQETVQQSLSKQPFDPPKWDPATKAAFMYSHKIWDAHKIIGFGLCFLLMTRVLIEVKSSKKDRILSRINAAVNIRVSDGDEHRDKKHYLSVKRGYVIFYILILTMATTGIIMAFDHSEIFKSVARPAHEIHSFVQYLIYAYVLTHLIGVIRADMTKQKGIVSAMINGGA
jgi:Ni,Fe-hydrogenase I cytochrome b subunit